VNILDPPALAALPEAGERRRLFSLSGNQKAAPVLLWLGAERSAPLLRTMSRREVSAVIGELAKLGTVDAVTANEVLDEFLNMATGVGDQPLPRGDVKTARLLLEESLGDRAAYEVLRDVNKSAPEVPFQFLHGLEPGIVASFLKDEHPQTIALVLTNLTMDYGVDVLSALPTPLLTQVAVRVGTLDRVTSTALEAVERGLKKRMAPILENTLAPGTGGVDTLVELLTKLDKDAETAVYSALEEYDAHLAVIVRGKMFIFDDLVLLDDRQMQLALRQIDAAKLPLALKGVKDEVKSRVLDNLSSRARENLLDEIELLGQVRLSDVTAAQNEILDAVRALEESGEIVIDRGGGDYVS
jgi:flagellar motor switch protein FliG